MFQEVLISEAVQKEKYDSVLFLDPEIVKMGRFLGPEIIKK